MSAWFKPSKDVPFGWLSRCQTPWRSDWKIVAVVRQDQRHEGDENTTS